MPTTRATARPPRSRSRPPSTDVPLEGTPWTLQGTLPETTITLEFGNGTLSGNSGCNTYNAGYSSTKAAGSSNSISVGPITSTQMACPDEVMAQEQTYLANLQSAGAYTISGSTLTLNTAGGPLVYGAPDGRAVGRRRSLSRTEN